MIVAMATNAKILYSVIYAPLEKQVLNLQRVPKEMIKQKSLGMIYEGQITKRAVCIQE